MIDDGYSEHDTRLDIDKQAFWPGERPAAEGPAPSVRSVAMPACDGPSAIYAAQPRRVAHPSAN